MLYYSLMARYWSQGSTHYRAAQHKTQAKNKNNFVSHIPTDGAKNLPKFFWGIFQTSFFFSAQNREPEITVTILDFLDFFWNFLASSLFETERPLPFDEINQNSCLMWYILFVWKKGKRSTYQTNTVMETNIIFKDGPREQGMPSRWRL